jgi:uncharacterized protein YigA (DUF484 family)
MTERTDMERLQDRIDRIENYIDLLSGAAQENDAMIVTLTSSLAQCYAAKAQLSSAQSFDEISSYLGGIVSLLDHPAVADMLGTSGDDSDEDEEEEEEAGEA